MKKIYLIPMLAVFGIALAFAGVYLVNSFVIQSDVYEPFEVSYAILGDAGNYDGGSCGDYAGEWTDYSTLEQPVDVGGLYVGESRRFCVKVNNLGEGDVPFVVQSEVVEGLGNLEACQAAFPEITETEVANGSQETLAGVTFTVPADAEPVEDCQVQVKVSRGTLE
jgi:hypothetical protein